MTPWQSLFDRGAEHDVGRPDIVGAVSRRRADAAGDDDATPSDADDDPDRR